jgi:flagellar biosynthesis protein FlhF
MVPLCEDLDGASGAARRIALIGPAGVGKTTTLAKLAAHHKLRRNRQVAIISTDSYRVGASVQIERYAEIIGAPSAVAATPRALRAALHRFAESDLILIDTPGAGPRDEERLTAMRELLATAAPDEVHLTLPGSMSLDAQLQAVRAFAPMQPTHVALTKLDEAVGFGVILNTIDQLHLRLSYITSGQGVPDDLIHACGERVAELVLP